MSARDEHRDSASPPAVDMVSKLLLKFDSSEGCPTNQRGILGALYEAERILTERGLGRISVYNAGENGAILAVTGPDDLDAALTESVTITDRVVSRNMVGYQILQALRSPGTPDVSIPAVFSRLMREPDTDVTSQALEITEALHAERMAETFDNFATELMVYNPKEDS